jgi:hypothetical protein
MRTYLFFTACIASSLATAQTVTSVYNRDTHEPFHLKSVRVESTVVGPMVKTSTLLTYENPYKALTEATLNFQMPEAAALGGFAYYFGNEYVRGRLMDKAKAWFIYTAITSRNRDPGIMEQWSPTEYHCQIYPIKTGADLRVRLWTVAMLQPKGDKIQVPKPEVPRAVSYYSTADKSIVAPDWTVRSVNPGALQQDGNDYYVDMPGQVQAVAQRFKDGRTYVAGLLKLSSHVIQPIQVTKAFYEPADGRPGGADVTAKVQDLLSHGSLAVHANNHTFGDPAPYIVKRLRVVYSAGDGTSRTVSVPENDILHLTNGDMNVATKFPSLRQTKTVTMDPQTVAFCGWLPHNQKIKAKVGLNEVAFRPERIAPGSDAARLWAQQMLATNQWHHSREVLAFSLKYGVPSNATALLAVPNEEMAKFREKDKEFEKAKAEERRREREAARQNRHWAGNRNQNWSNSGGGDPEIRVSIPGAQSVEAILPDRRVIDLSQEGDFWGGNFEIPADAPEGSYPVRVIAHMPDGTTSERSWTYEVDRTPPVGTAKFLTENGQLILEVRCAKKLAEVAAYAPDGTKFVLRMVTPGVYRAEIPSGIGERLTVVMKDMAGNKGTLLCSRPQ